MSDRIKKIKIKQADGTFSDYIPIGANAKDIDLQYNDSNVENILKKKPYYYDNVEAMKLDDALREGDMAITLGYYEANDNGGAEYEIISGEYEDDNGSYISILNNLYAKLIVKDGRVSYNQFGARGDGITEDWDALYNTHTFANKNNYTVIGLTSSTYYICEAREPIIIQSNVDWQNCTIIIDDTLLTMEDTNHIFYIKSNLSSTNLYDSNQNILKPQINKTDTTITSEVTNLTHDGGYIVEVFNRNKNIYIRKMDSSYTMDKNWESAERLAQQEVFRVDNKNNILDPISWDYLPNGYTSIVAYPIDTVPLVVSNATIITKMNNTNFEHNTNRDFQINRSNVTINNITHLLENNLPTSKYNAFLSVRVAANVNINNCNFSGHNRQGSYDINLYKALNVKLNHIRQINSIMDKSQWGIFASSLSKNIYISNSYLNRIDAHMGIYNLFVNNCIIGNQQIKIIGGGICKIENTTVYSDMAFLEMRMDYGSTFEGDIIIKNCKLTRIDPNNTNNCSIIYTHNNGQWDFGYKCFLGKNIEIENFIYDDNKSNTVCNIIHLGGSIPAEASIYNNNYDVCVSTYNRYPYILASNIKLKDIKSLNNKSGLLFYGVDFFRLWIEETGTMTSSLDHMQNISNNIYNCQIDIDNCIFGDNNKIDNIDTETTHQNSFYGEYVWPGSYGSLTNTHHPIVKMNIKNCDKIQIDSYYRPIDWTIENCNIYHITNLHKESELTKRYSYYSTFILKSCKIYYGYDNDYSTSKHFYIAGNNYNIDNCLFINTKNTSPYKSIKTYGNSESRPVNKLSYEIPQNFIYYDTTLKKNIYWNDNKWYLLDTNEEAI